MCFKTSLDLFADLLHKSQKPPERRTVWTSVKLESLETDRGGGRLISVSLLPGAKVQLDGQERVSLLQTRVEDVKIYLPQSLQVVLQHHLQHTTPQKKSLSGLAERETLHFHFTAFIQLHFVLILTNQQREMSFFLRC